MLLFVANFRMVATKETKRKDTQRCKYNFAFQAHHRPPSKGVYGEEESQKHTR
jgi:hypothetical protein